MTCSLSQILWIHEVFINRYGRSRSVAGVLRFFFCSRCFYYPAFSAAPSARFHYLPAGLSATGLFRFRSAIRYADKGFVGWLCGKYLEGCSALGTRFTKNWLKDGVGAVVRRLVGLAALITIIFGAMTFHQCSGGKRRLSTLAVSLISMVAEWRLKKRFSRLHLWVNIRVPTSFYSSVF